MAGAERNSPQSFLDDVTPEGRAVRQRLAKGMQAQFDRQPRIFAYQLVFVHDRARIIRWDRSCAVVTEAIDYRKNGRPLADFLVRLSHASREQQRGR